MLSRFLSRFQPDYAALQAARFAETVAFAREHSPFYRDRYRDLPEVITDHRMLPVTTKPELMERFDDWATDRRITRAAVDEFVADTSKIGTLFLDEYLVAFTSGTSRVPGLFLTSTEELRITTQPGPRPNQFRDVVHSITSGTAFKILKNRQRLVCLTSIHGHFLLNGMWALNGATETSPQRRLLSANLPVSTLVAELNAYQPAIVVGYAGLLSILTSEQEAGRLAISPALITISGEGLPESDYARMSKAFGAEVIDRYGANEAILLSGKCRAGWHHIHSDWVIFEPVDEDHSPTPPGRFSHSVLLSVLYRKSQPILRYDLGDSVLQQDGACACGSPFPSFKIHGRSFDLMRSADGTPKTLVRLFASDLRDAVGGITLTQLRQLSPNELALRLQLEPTADRERTWARIHEVLPGLFDSYDLEGLTIVRDDEPIERNAGGKYPAYVRVE